MAEGDLTGTWREYLLDDGVVDFKNLAEGVAAGLSGGFTYIYSTNTEATDPGAGKLKFDKAALAEAIALRISETDDNGNAIAAWLAQLDDSTNTIRGTITIAKVGDPNAFAIFNVSGALVDNGGWDSISVAHVVSQGLVNNDVVTITFNRAGNVGAAGEKGGTGAEGRWASLRYVHLTNTEETDPGAGKLKFNAGKTSLRISETDGDGGGIGAYLAAWDDSTTTGTRGFIILRKIGTPATFAIYKVTGALVDKGAWDTLPVELVSSNGELGNESALSVEFYRTGDKGEKGEKGETGGKGESPGTVKLVEASLSAAGTGNLSWQYSNASMGVLVLIVADDTTPSDEVSEVTIAGRKMYELPSSPFLHTAGSEDGVIYAYWLSYPGISGTVTVTVSGASTKRALAIGFSSNGDLLAACDVATKDSAAAKTFDSEELGRVMGRNFLVAALHCGADAIGTVTVPADEQILTQHDFGTTTAHWAAMLEDHFNPENIVFNSSIEEEGGLFAVAISPVIDHGVVSQLPTENLGIGDRCSYVADATNGIIWNFIYDGVGEYPWKFIGGTPLRADDFTNRETKSEAYQTTGAPSVESPLSMEFRARYGSNLVFLTEGGATEAFCGLFVAGTVKEDVTFVGQAIFDSTGLDMGSDNYTIAATQAVQTRYHSNNGRTFRWNGLFVEITPIRAK